MSTGLILCGIAFVVTLYLGLRSLVYGLASVMTFGYFYGILRANYLDGLSHFIFDAAAVGLYLSALVKRPPGWAQTGAVQKWAWALIGWSCLMAAIPIQHYLIQLVGLRGNAFLLPFLMLGACLGRRDANLLACWLAVLNLLAFGFATAEYFTGIERFYPLNPVTELIYRSKDVVGYTAYRIPATFANAHAYAGTMVVTLPWLLGALGQGRLPPRQAALLLAGAGVALLGNFMAATRVQTATLLVLFLLVPFSGRLRGGVAVGLIVVVCVVGYIVAGEERMQRFTSLSDPEAVMGRIQGSVNLSTLELLTQYPMGNGMGAGGTSIPYFLQHLVTDTIGVENEYGRIMLEQGFPGLVLWAAFILWLAFRPLDRNDPWFLGRQMMWASCMMGFALSLLGTGLLTSIPQSSIMLMNAGFMVAGLPARRKTAAEPTRKMPARTLPPGKTADVSRPVR